MNRYSFLITKLIEIVVNIYWDVLFPNDFSIIDYYIMWIIKYLIIKIKLFKLIIVYKKRC